MELRSPHGDTANVKLLTKGKEYQNTDRGFESRFRMP